MNTTNDIRKLIIFVYRVKVT